MAQYSPTSEKRLIHNNKTTLPFGGGGALRKLDQELGLSGDCYTKPSRVYPSK